MKNFSIFVNDIIDLDSNFEFVIKNEFFEIFEQSTIKGGDVNVNMAVKHQSNGWLINLKLEGSIKLICDICLEEFDFDVDIEENITARKGNETSFDSGDEFINVNINDNEIDFAPLFYDLLVLIIPIRKEHPEDENGFSVCNAKMLKKLEEYRIKEIKTDPRWDSLKSIN